MESNSKNRTLTLVYGMRNFILAVFVLAALCGSARAEILEYCNPSGWEERGQEYVQWLAPSIRLNGASGTMCYYDKQQNWMYIISAGHLFDHFRLRVNVRQTAKVEVFYYHNVKLAHPRVYSAEVLASVFNHDDQDGGAYDVSLLRFHPDVPDLTYIPIAPKEYKLEQGRVYHSVGCDQEGKGQPTTEPAHYLVRVVGEQSIGRSITQVLTVPGPRHGRSGGGVFSDDGYLVFICSREGGGSKYGMWTSLSQIHRFLGEHGYSFIADEIPARRMSIVDLDNPGHTYSHDYVLVPLGNK
jgi:hypothetical protein